MGKSTFLDLLTKVKAKPDTGEIIPGITTKIGYFTKKLRTVILHTALLKKVKEIAEFATRRRLAGLRHLNFRIRFYSHPKSNTTLLR